MFCPQCGTEIENEADVCTSCGASLAALKPTRSRTKASKGRRRLWLFVIPIAVVLLLILAGAGGLWAYWRSRPTGGQIAFLRDKEGEFSLLIIDQDGHNLRHVVDDAAGISFPLDPVTRRPTAFSPDGRHLLFKVKESEGMGLYLADHTGQEVSSLVQGQADVWAVYSPSGRHILVATQNAEGTQGLYVYDVKREEQTRLAAKVERAWGTFSPNGRRVLIAVREVGRTELHLSDLDGENTVELIEDVHDAWAGFANRGDRLLLWIKEEADEPGTLFLTDLQGKSRHEVMTAEWAWAFFMPGDDRIWMQFAQAGRHSIGVVNAQGNYETEVLGGATDIHLRAVAGGSRLAFAARGAKGWDLYAVEVDGTHLVELTSAAEQLNWWLSSSGRWLTYVRLEGAKAKLVLVATDGQVEETLAGDTEGVENVDFAHDETRVVYDVQRIDGEKTERAIYTLNLEEMTGERLVDKGYYPVWGKKPQRMPWQGSD